MLKIAIHGTGRMAMNTAQAALDDETVELVAVYGRNSNPFLGQDIGRLLGVGDQGVNLVPLSDDASKNAVYIDFSHPQMTLELLKFPNTSPILIGTTGFSEPEMELLKKASLARPILFAPNTSLGVAILRKLSREVAQILGPDYDVDVRDIHHRHKKDAPSGTAKSIIESIAMAPGFHTASNPSHVRERGAINITVERSGGVIGEHTVSFTSEDEAISITHKALDRKLFARGAINAAKWLSNAGPGFYSMENVVGL